MDRSYRVSSDGRGVVCDTIVERADVGALADALAWRRNELSREELQEADAVLALRALMVLDDMLAATADYEERAPLTLTRDQARVLCQISGAYVSERDLDGYQSPEERDRIERLRGLAGRLMDTCSELVTAEDDARERAILV